MGRGRVVLLADVLTVSESEGDRISQRDELLTKITGAGRLSVPPPSRQAGGFAFVRHDVSRHGRGRRVGAGVLDRSRRIARGVHRRRPFRDVSDVPPRNDAQSGQLSGEAMPTPAERTVNAAVCVERRLEPRASAEATFVFAWHFPHQYYPQNTYRLGDNKAIPVGNMYANWYHDARDVARHVLSARERLTGDTFAFRDAVFDTTLPQYVIDAVAANVSIIRSPTCFWTKDSTFYGFEGCVPGGGGCCPMNCNHVWNYEQTLAKLWPALERDMRKTELRHHQRQDGGTNHRVAVPRDSKDKHAPPVADGQCGAVLKAYREHLQSRDRRFLGDYWTRIKLAMDFAIETWGPGSRRR